MHRVVTLPLALAITACAALPAVPRPDPGSAQGEVAQYLARIDALDDRGPMLNAVIAINPAALRSAAAARAIGGPLAGKAVLVKDNIETADAMATTAGSLALKDNVTGRDAPLIARLRRAGGVILGKTNLSEWANIRSSASSSGWSAVGGQTKNPHATDRNPCGSSSGSGAAVAAGLAWAAIGTETDGSITCPASANGIVGFKPTVGLVSRTHIVPISHSQDTAGPMAGSVRDAALLLSAIAGPDPADPATADAGAHMADFAAGLAGSSLQGVRIGVMRQQVGAHAGVARLFDQAVADLRRAGAQVVEIAFTVDPAMYAAEGEVLYYEFKHGLGAYLAGLPGDPPVRSLADLIAFNRANAAEELRWFGQETFEKAVKLDDPAAHARARATSLRLAGTEGIDKLMAANRVAFLIAPTAPPAWPTDLVAGDHYLDIGAGSLPAIAGYPHLTVPMGAVEGLPVGLSIFAGKWQDKAVLEAGAAYERARTAPLHVPTLRRWGE